MTDPREFQCFDDDPRNNGNGYNHPNQYDDYPEDDREQIENIPLEEEREIE